MMLAPPDIGFDQYQMAAIYSSCPKGIPRKVGCMTVVSARETGAARGRQKTKNPEARALRVCDAASLRRQFSRNGRLCIGYGRCVRSLTCDDRKLACTATSRTILTEATRDVVATAAPVGLNIRHGEY